ncbi:molybdopterin oxidoreductase family protein, partial [Demequina sp. TTPB684]
FGGGGLTNEKAYALGKFARVALGTPYIDYNGRFCMSSAAAAANRTFGMDRGLGFPLADLGGADAVLIMGSNVAVTMPPLVQHLAGVRERGGLIYVDPRVTATSRLAEDGRGLHLQIVPGTDMAVLLTLLHVLIDEGLTDESYLAERTSGWEAVRASVSQWWPERAEAVTGVPAEKLRATARLLAAASPSRGGKGAYILTGRGLEQMASGTDAVSAAINLALALGLPGRVGSGYAPVTGQGNGQGGREHGLKADQLPGYSLISDPARRDHVAGVWGVDPDTLPGPGVPAVQLLASLGTPAAPGTPGTSGKPGIPGTPAGPKALLVHGSNVVVSAPNADEVTRSLQSLDFLVVADVVHSETASYADVVLPVTQWAEEEGTMTNLEGRVLRRRKAVDAPGQAKSELWVLAELARRLGCAAAFPTEASDVFDELAKASAGGVADYSGITYSRLDAGEQLHWPCPASDGADHPGTERVFLDRFAKPDGLAHMVAVRYQGPRDDVRASATLYLVTGRVLAHYQSGAQTRRVAELAAAEPEAYVQIHLAAAADLGVEEGDLVTVTSTRGSVVVPARLSADVRPDTVFMPFHWAGSANVLTNDAVDPVSGMPEFKVCAVSVERFAQEAAA